MIYRFTHIVLILVLVPAVLLGQSAAELLATAQTLRMSDLDSSNWYATRAYRASLESEQDSTALKSQFLLGTNLQMQGSLEKAVAVYKQILSSVSLESYPEQYIQSVGRTGDCYTDLGIYDSAMVYLIEFDRLVDTYWSPNKIDAKLLLGELYRAMGRMQKSDEYKIEAIRRSEHSGNSLERTIALYYYLDDHRGELDSPDFHKYLSDYTGLLNANNPTHIDLSHMSMFLPVTDEEEKTEHLERALLGLGQAGYHSTTLIYRTLLVERYLEDSAYLRALGHAERAIQLTNRIDDKRYACDLQYYLFKIHYGLENYDRAIKYLQEHYRIKEQLQDSEISKRIDNLNMRYETSRKERQITEQQLEIRQSKYQRNLLFVGLAMALWFGAFLIIYFWRRNRITNRLALQASHINQQKILQLEQEKNLLAMSSMIQGQEAERKRIARDLHDGLGGLLSNIKAQLYDIERRVDSLAGVDLYGKASNMIDEASREVRRIAYDMMPVALSQLGLEAAIEDLASSLESHHNMEVDLQLFGLGDRLDETTEVMLYRIIQELCNNVVKHASASEILIQTMIIENDLILVVEDNGKGFDQESARNNGLGMKSLASRVRFLNGEMDIASSSEGTCISIQVPIS